MADELKKISRALAAMVLISVALASTASAGEPRPWLCRDKPVFSDSHPMRYQVSSKGGSWQIFFMQLASFSGGESRGSHDGFTIVDSRQLSRTPQSGSLPSGSYYAVALFQRGGAWICSYGDEGSPSPGVIKNLCYSPIDNPGCPASLSVKSGQ